MNTILGVASRPNYYFTRRRYSHATRRESRRPDSDTVSTGILSYPDIIASGMSRAHLTTKNVYTVVSFYTERSDVSVFRDNHAML